MKNLIKWLSSTNWIYLFTTKLLANRIIHSDKPLTPDYLKSKGWIEENGFWIEPRIKDRDKIWIQFEHHYFRIFHGSEKTFIGLKSSLEWFETYYLIVQDSDRLYELAGI